MCYSIRVLLLLCFFFFKQKTAYEMRISDWSSDVCSSDLRGIGDAECGEIAVVADRPIGRVQIERACQPFEFAVEQIALDLQLVGVLLVADQLIGVEDMARHTVEVAEIFALDLAKAEDVGDGHGAEIEIGAVGHAQRSRTVVIVDVATIEERKSTRLNSSH